MIPRFHRVVCDKAGPLAGFCLRRIRSLWVGCMRLGIAVFRFLPDGEWLKGCTMTNTKALAHIVPDKTYRGMWRAVRPDGSLSDMVNKTRAKDVAWGLAENAVYLGNAA